MQPYLIRDIGAIYRLSLAGWARRLPAGAGLAGHQIPYLWSVCQTPGLSQEALARSLYVDKSNVARNIGALERLGYVERRRDGNDRRGWRIWPTERAFDLLPHLVVAVRDWEDVLLNGMSSEERELAGELIADMRQNVDAVAGETEGPVDSELPGM